MKILKLIDGFITNSSSSGVIIIIALQKGKSFKEIINKLGKPAHLPSDFFYFEDYLTSDYFEDDEDLELDHLTDEYDILYESITFEESGGDYYSMPEAQINAFHELLNKLKSYSGKEIILLSEDYWP